jgi:hypothetical protein
MTPFEVVPEALGVEGASREVEGTGDVGGEEVGEEDISERGVGRERMGVKWPGLLTTSKNFFTTTNKHQRR